MSAPITIKLALRSLRRNVRRTLLSVLGVGIGVGVALFLTAFMRGSEGMRVRAVAESGVGHIRIAPASWQETHDEDLRLPDGQASLRTARAHEEVEVATPRARTEALLAFGTRTTGVEMVGVDPVTEPQLNRIAQAVATGRYLRPEDRGATVVGSTIADRLDVELDDDLLLTVVDAAGEMRYAMLRIVGIVATGSRELDAGICHVTLEELERVTGRPGVAEITLLLKDPRRIDAVAAELRQALTPGQEVLTWDRVVPAIGGDARSDQAFTNMILGTVVAVVILGITSAQLTSVLERKREFAVLVALGMKSRQVLRLVLLEAVTLGIVGGAVGLLLATPLVYHWATAGFDFTQVTGQRMTLSGVLFDPVIYADMGLWMIPYAFILACVATLLTVLFPAWSAMRTNPTTALSLREA